MSKEVWKPIAGYEGLYEVSNFGRIRSVRVIKCHSFEGRAQVTLHKKRKRTMHRVARIVCRAFNGEPPTPKHEANHIDGKHTNDHADNLEWLTSLENHQHALKLGLKSHGETHGTAKLKEDQVKVIWDLIQDPKLTDKEIANHFAVSRTTISMIRHRRIWKRVTSKL